MKHKVLKAFLLGIIALGSTASKAEEVDQWIKDSTDHPVAVGVAAGAATAAGSVTMGALHLANYNHDARYWAKEGMKENPFFEIAAAPYLKVRSHVHHEMQSTQEKLKEAQIGLETVSKNGGGNSGAALRLQHEIKDLQTLISQYKHAEGHFDGEIEEVRKYLASGGNVANKFSAAERYRLNEFTHGYQAYAKDANSLLKHAASLRAQGKQAFKKSLEWALLGIPVGTVAPFVLDKIRESAIEDQKQEKALAESHSSPLNLSPGAIWTAGNEAK